MNEARVRSFQQGDIVVRQGDYGNSAFIILSGAARVILDTVDEALIGRHQPQRKNFFEVLSQLLKNPDVPEVRHFKHSTVGFKEVSGGRADLGDTAIFVQDVSSILTGKRTRNPGGRRIVWRDRRLEPDAAHDHGGGGLSDGNAGNTLARTSGNPVAQPGIQGIR